MREKLVVTVLPAAAAAACAVTLVPGVLVGRAVMNGSARGTAAVGLAASALLVALVVVGRRGSWRVRALTTGVVAYLLYSAVMFAFATPFNRAFLLYVAMLGLALWSLVLLALELAGVPSSTRRPPRWTAAYIWVVVVLNALAWLRGVLPAVVGHDPLDLLTGSGLTTNPVYVQDLAIWLPLFAWLAAGVWRGSQRATAWATAATAFWVVESVSVAVDQWLGHRADPASSWASAGAVPLFAAMAVVGTVPLLALVRCLPRRSSRGPLVPAGGGPRPSPVPAPPADRGGMTTTPIVVGVHETVLTGQAPDVNHSVVVRPVAVVPVG